MAKADLSNAASDEGKSRAAQLVADLEGLSSVAA
jgi:hypothetical protein